MSPTLAGHPARLLNPWPWPTVTPARLRDYALGALFGAALATLLLVHVYRQPAPPPGVAESDAGLMLETQTEGSAERRELNDSVTPSTVLGPAISNR